MDALLSSRELKSEHTIDMPFGHFAVRLWVVDGIHWIVFAECRAIGWTAGRPVWRICMGVCRVLYCAWHTKVCTRCFF